MIAVREALIEQVAQLICTEQTRGPAGRRRGWVWYRVSDDEREEYRRIADAVIGHLLPGLGEENV